MALISVFIETYGCQMNLNDTEIVKSIMTASGASVASELAMANVILLNTCSVRDNAEERILNRIDFLHHFLKKQKRNAVIGVIGCMAERLKGKLFELSDFVSIVVGPDEYRKLPEIASNALKGSKDIAVELSKTETYSDILPLRKSGFSAWLSIMRGCNNFCSYCIVPYTRGRERSRDTVSILNEIDNLITNNFKEVTLLGQNVNSYNFNDTTFPKLLETIAIRAPKMRIRFITSHPRDMSDELIETIAKYDNICNYVHLALQSGSDRILKEMNRRYTVEHFLDLVTKLREAIPNCAISTDVIAGYPTETEEDHKDTLNLMQKIRFDSAFMFKYSPREGTKAANIIDNVPEEEKVRRLNEIINLQNNISREKNALEVGKIVEILVENPSRKNTDDWVGRTDTNKVVIFNNKNKKYQEGDFLNLKINKTTSATLFGETIEE